MLDLWGFESVPVAAPLFSATARVAVLGSRSWPSSGPAAALIRSFVASLPRGSVVLSGGQRGADALASSCAFHAGLSVVSFPAPWFVGVSAGPRRSAALLRSLCPVGCSCAACAPVVCSMPARAWLSRGVCLPWACVPIMLALPARPCLGLRGFFSARPQFAGFCCCGHHRPHGWRSVLVVFACWRVGTLLAPPPTPGPLRRVRLV